MRKCKVRGFELWATALCVLALRARCLSLRALFSLNMLALLHRCYMERFWEYRGDCCSPVVGFSQNSIISHIPQFVFAFFHKSANRGDFQRRAFIYLSKAAFHLRPRIRCAISVREAL